ncbi:OLC1v1004777C2 [Oldenlandia corymbosa var. corymbosa]|uniref:OLC1v1004777C2 n=1 Tax=Oldenlandia corymbosa var. corymbosa TaxID=529605 RepID=A0AAV1DDU1_OLDCO|nr:OLC1v1004777C2 [Oldenlandia corymbosa var. corymbosa]
MIELYIHNSDDAQWTCRLIGRSAFTGSHAWILAEGYRRDAHPPEVVKEVCLQFSAGMQTIAVVPVLPHGVVQFGSYVPMMENVAFINDVKSLVLQLGCVPGVLLSESYATREPVPRVGVPICPGNPLNGNYLERSETYNSTPLIYNPRGYDCSLSEAVTRASQTSCSVGQIPDVGLCSSLFQSRDLGGGLLGSHDAQPKQRTGLLANSQQSTTSQLAPLTAKAEVLSSNPEVWLNKQSSLCTSSSHFDQKLPVVSSIMNAVGLKYEQISSETGFQGHMDNSFNISSDMVTNADLVSTVDSVTLHSANRINMHGDVKSNLQSVPSFMSHSEGNLISCKNNSSSQSRNETQNANSSKSEVSCSKVVEHSSESNLLTSSSVTVYPSADNKFIVADFDDVYGGLEHDLYQALSGSISKPDVSNLSESVPGITPKDEKPGCGMQNLSLGDAVNAGQHYTGNDLFDILGVDFRNKLLNSEWNSSQISMSDSSITYLDKTNSKSFKGADASKDTYAVNQEKSDNSIFSVTSADHLLEAVISKVQPSLSCRTSLTNTSSLSAPTMSSSSSGFPVTGHHLQGDLYAFPKSIGKLGGLGSCSFTSGPGKDNKSSYSNSGSICGSQLSSWIEQQDVKPSSSVSTAYSKKTDEMSKTKKRLKPGENPRPRPKDRQMIQDRVKELREIVPNGAKCSIDALLERTIKHMLFLQSVTKHADKLKQTGDTKIISKEGGLLIKDNYDGGATWAYEVGSQSMVCPIIVEDLNQPRQMLVEMLCEERGLFLEIADIIRGLGLTILKGVMETRNDKIWARFAVEANRDVTRMEIFISLVRLLEQTAKNGVPPGNCVENDTMMAHQFQPATSIPASGRPCDL